MQSDQILNKKEEYDQQKRKEVRQERGKANIKRVKKWSMWFVAAMLATAAIFYFWKNNFFTFEAVKAPENKLISAKGIHWHAQMTIKILGQTVDVPANLGIGVVHNPIHTHDKDGILHLEFPGRVDESDLKLVNLFELWNKTFNKDCIFDKCNGPAGSLKMLVNGQPGYDFENHIMRDGDRIEIIFDGPNE